MTNAGKTLFFHDEGDNPMLCLTQGFSVLSICLHTFILKKKKKALATCFEHALDYEVATKTRH